MHTPSALSLVSLWGAVPTGAAGQDLTHEETEAQVRKGWSEGTGQEEEPGCWL